MVECTYFGLEISRPALTLKKPNPVDWDVNFPPGWQSTDVAAATTRVFSRIPGTDIPSKDGLLYNQNGYNVIASGLETAGWTYVTANNVPG